MAVVQKPLEVDVEEFRKGITGVSEVLESIGTPYIAVTDDKRFGVIAINDPECLAIMWPIIEAAEKAWHAATGRTPSENTYLIPKETNGE